MGARSLGVKCMQFCVEDEFPVAQSGSGGFLCNSLPTFKQESINIINENIFPKSLLIEM